MQSAACRDSGARRALRLQQAAAWLSTGQRRNRLVPIGQAAERPSASQAPLLTCSLPGHPLPCRWASPPPPRQNPGRGPEGVRGSGRACIARAVLRAARQCSLVVRKQSQCQHVRRDAAGKERPLLQRATHHARDHPPLLVVLAPKHSHIRLHDVQQLGHNLERGAWQPRCMQHAARAPFASSCPLISIHPARTRARTVVTPRKKCGRDLPHSGSCSRSTCTKVSCASGCVPSRPTTLPASPAGPAHVRGQQVSMAGSKGHTKACC